MKKIKWSIAGLIFVLLIVAVAFSGGCQKSQPEMAADLGSRFTRFDNVIISNGLQVNGGSQFDMQMQLAVPTAQGTATPALVVENDSVANSIEVRNPASTPVFYVDVDGNVTYTGMSSGGGLIQNAVAVQAPTAVATNTPAFSVDSLGAGNNLFEIRDAATPIAAWNNGGNYTLSGEGLLNNVAKVSAPTAVTTATPAFVVDSLAAASSLLEVRDAATPVFSVYNGGTFLASGAGTTTGLTDSGGLTESAWAKVAGPTAIATATPAMVVDSLGVSNILEVRDAATPVAYWANGGALTQVGNTVIQGTLTTGASATTGTDVTFYSETSGDNLLWDASEAVLAVTGTNGQTAVNVADGNLVVNDNATITAGNLEVTAGTLTVGAGITTLPMNVENIGTRSVISVAVTYQSSGAIATVGDGELWFIEAVLANVTSNFNCTGDNCTLQIGDGNDANGLLDLVDAELQTADTEGTGWAAGWQGMQSATLGAYLTGSPLFVYAPSGSAETIDITIGGTDPAAGAATIYIVYTRIY